MVCCVHLRGCFCCVAVYVSFGLGLLGGELVVARRRVDILANMHAFNAITRLLICSSSARIPTIPCRAGADRPRFTSSSPLRSFPFNSSFVIAKGRCVENVHVIGFWLIDLTDAKTRRAVQAPKGGKVEAKGSPRAPTSVWRCWLKVAPQGWRGCIRNADSGSGRQWRHKGCSVGSRVAGRGRLSGRHHRGQARQDWSGNRRRSGSFSGRRVMRAARWRPELRCG